jgi:ankyrin repeat protein
MSLEMKSLPARIIDAIKNDAVDALRVLLTDNPEQLTWNTPFAGQTWLGYAGSKGMINSMVLMEEFGADINQGDHRENVKPICSAAANSQVESVEFLLENGAVLDTETSVQNPLFSAVVGRSPIITKLLLEAGIDSTVRYSSQTMKNMDAIAFALMRGEKECAQITANWMASGDETKAHSLLKEADEIAKYTAYGKKA